MRDGDRRGRLHGSRGSSHSRHLDGRCRDRRGSRHAAFGDPTDVFLGDPAVGAGAGDLGQFDAQLPSRLAGGRSGENPTEGVHRVLDDRGRLGKLVVKDAARVGEREFRRGSGGLSSRSLGLVPAVRDGGLGAGFHLDHDDHVADVDDLAGLTNGLDDLALAGRGNLDGGLVGHDLEHGLVRSDLVAGLHQPGNQFALDHALADVGETELQEVLSLRCH
ncbi:hypothetical protein D3C86_455990 [compost metagenome]